MPRPKTLSGRKPANPSALSEFQRLKITVTRMLDMLDRALEKGAADEDEQQNYDRLFGGKPLLVALDTLLEMALKLHKREKEDTATASPAEASMRLSEADEVLVQDFLKRAREPIAPEPAPPAVADLFS
jgi:hypothetical protein